LAIPPNKLRKLIKYFQENILNGTIRLTIRRLSKISVKESEISKEGDKKFRHLYETELEKKREQKMRRIGQIKLARERNRDAEYDLVNVSCCTCHNISNFGPYLGDFEIVSYIASQPFYSFHYIRSEIPLFFQTQFHYSKSCHISSFHRWIINILKMR
jgi:hypothetical protein